METGNYKSRIENLKSRLYSRKASLNKTEKNINLKPKEFDLKPTWGSKEIDSNKLNIENIMGKKKKFTLNKLFISSIIFLFLAGVFAFFSLTGGGNSISSDNIDIELSGPVSIGSGEILTLEIDILNKNSVSLETADLLIEYPEGTRASSNIKNVLKRDRQSFQTIKSGEKKSTVAKSVLFGEEGTKKEIKIGIEYRVPGSNAIFYKEKKYEIEINASPVSLAVSSPKEINSGQEIEFKIDVKSNSENKIENLLLEAEFPFGFKPGKSTPNSSFGDNLWEISLNPLEKKTIYISGAINGQDGEKRTFRFNVGVKKDNDEKTIEVNFITYSEQITIKKSFISLNMSVNRDSSLEDQITSAGETVRVDISWKNNLETKITDAVLKVELDGDIIDESSISSLNGFYNSANNTITWDKRNISGLGVLESGDGGDTSFSFRTLNNVKDTLSRVPEINIYVTIDGTEPTESGSTSRIITSATTRKIKVSSNVSLNPRPVYYSGKLINNGPIPPKVGSETTYTVIISLSNSINDVSGGKVKMVLPSYIRWMGTVVPSEEKVSFNPVGGEVEWSVGDIYKGIGYTREAKEVQFQIALTPSSSQIGSSAVLVDNIVFTGMDTFTDTEIKITGKQLTTRLKTDSKFKDGDDVVIK
ncbi:MAG: hypothetical protein WC849_02450 [Candidatus Paceibacterota bacterium]